MPFPIVQAGPPDTEIITEMAGELLQEIMVAIGSRAFAFDPMETEARLRGWLSERTYIVFLARAGGDAAGFVSLYQSYALYAEGTFGTIPELYVRPAYRSQGWGQACWPRPGSMAGQNNGRGWR